MVNQTDFAAAFMTAQLVTSAAAARYLATKLSDIGTPAHAANRVAYDAAVANEYIAYCAACG